MTKEELLRENQELKDRIIELQSEIIRLKSQFIPRSPDPPEKDISPLEPYYSKYPSSTGDPLPPLYETTSVGMQWNGTRIEKHLYSLSST